MSKVFVLDTEKDELYKEKGLTKREYIAIAVYQALLEKLTPQLAAKKAVECADTLLEELNR